MLTNRLLKAIFSKKMVAGFLVYFSAMPTVWACFVAPVEQYVPAHVLIDRTANIVLAQVTKVRSEKVAHQAHYTFSTMQVLKGNAKPVFYVRGFRAPNRVANKVSKQESQSFNHHRQAIFWDNTQPTGRVHSHTDCEIHPSFEYKKTYLIFLDKPYHIKSFEWIENPKQDQWFNYVKKHIKPNAN